MSDGSGLSDGAWNLLLDRIERRECLPFVGAGASADRIGTGGELAREIARKWEEWTGTPFLWDPEMLGLATTAQFIAVSQGADEQLVKGVVVDKIGQADAPGLSDDREIHNVLAMLPLPVYVTTNYDEFLYQALRAKRDGDPRIEVPHWFPGLAQAVGTNFGPGDNYDPDRSNPLVYHLHGCVTHPDSMVLTDRDYLNYLLWLNDVVQVRLTPDQPHPVPHPLRSRLAGSLLFIGYSRLDWTFRVLYATIRSLFAGRSTATSIAVQLSPLDGDARGDEREGVKELLEHYFEALFGGRIAIYLGDVNDFARELAERWEGYPRRTDG